MFTMMDKHADYETKKYTAMREGLTEAIAIPCYMGVAWIANKVVTPMLYKGEKAAKAGKVFSFLGVCLAALVIIPAACSAAIKPIMNFIQDHKKKKTCCKNAIAQNNILNEVKTDIVQAAPVANVGAQPIQKIAPKSYQAFTPMNYNSGLKVGGGS